MFQIFGFGCTLPVEKEVTAMKLPAGKIGPYQEDESEAGYRSARLALILSLAVVALTGVYFGLVYLIAR